MDRFTLFAKDKQRGAISMIFALGFGLLLAFCALVVDLGYARMTRSQLQSAADSAAMAAVRRLIASDGTVDASGARAAAVQFAAKHAADRSKIELDENKSNSADGDIVIGKYNAQQQFVPTTDADADTVQATVRRTKENGKPVELFFAKIFGRNTVDLEAGSAASLVPVYTTKVSPLALRAPGFGVVDPTQPYKSGPSAPANGDHFTVGEKVALYFSPTDDDSRSACSVDNEDESDHHGDSEHEDSDNEDSDHHGDSSGHSDSSNGLFGFRAHFSKSEVSHDDGDSGHDGDSEHTDSEHDESDHHGDSEHDDGDHEGDSEGEGEAHDDCGGSSVHLVLDLERSGLVEDAAEVLEEDGEPVSVSIDDDFYVMSEGTGGEDFGKILKDRIDRYADDDHRILIVPVVDTDSHSRNSSGKLVGKVHVVDFVAVHLDGVERGTIPDPEHPGETIEIEKVMATVIHEAVSASQAREDRGVGGGSVSTVRLSS